MAPAREGGPEVVRSLARAFQERIIEPAALRQENQEARIKALEETLPALEQEIGRLRAALKKTKAVGGAALAGAAAALLYLLAK
ncbi:MAG: hypothetical protein K6T80_03335 [Firmicutes bacterium]|nr:hypothetical protein [Bacillota bacterium]